MMESSLIELMQHIDDTYRTRPPLEVEETY
jgi:hypothetical protein